MIGSVDTILKSNEQKKPVPWYNLIKHSLWKKLIACQGQKNDGNFAQHCNQRKCFWLMTDFEGTKTTLIL